MRPTESHILARVRALLPGGEALTDDCGALPRAPEGEILLVSTDLMEEGVHFHRNWHPPELLGRKLLAVNLSDLDGSGARPTGFTLTLALPQDLDLHWLEALLAGLGGAAREWGVPVIGGDTVGRVAGIGLGLTAFGSARRWLRRDGLRVGDAIYVDQPLGASTRGLRKLREGLRWDPAAPDEDLRAHLDPRPHLGLGPRLAEQAGVHAAMDLSDGLGKDLRMMALASGLTVRVTAPLSPEALHGGEDYARCFASDLPKEFLETALGLPFWTIGEVLAAGAEPVLLYDGREDRPLPDRSFDHFDPGPP